MSRQSLACASGRVCVSVLLLISTSYSLKCRTDDGPSESELKRITRSCMRKIGEKMYLNNGGSTGFYNNNNNNNNKHYGPLHQSNFGTQYKSNSRYDYNYDYDDDDNYNGNNNNNYNNNNYNNNGNYDRDRGNRNRERQQNNQNNRADNNNNRSASSSSSSTGNNNGGRYENGNSNGNSHANGGGGGGNGGGNGNSNNGGRNSGSSGGGGGGGGGGNSQRGQSQNNFNKNNNNNNNQGSNNDTADAACVVHCFFEEMNMLNSDDYPDRYKVQYGLTRELRDRELRNFYTDTIQDCFHYLESQRRRDKCHYSRDLVHCMSEYAKVNCDDWQEFSVVFN